MNMRKIALLGLAGLLFAGTAFAQSTPANTGTAASSPEQAEITSDLYFGMRNSKEVTALQNYLKSEGYYQGPITGNFLGQTMTAVKQFQKANGVNSTGYFGPISRAKLRRQGALRIEPAAPAVKVGESIELSAVFQPSMPPCPVGMMCIQGGQGQVTSTSLSPNAVAPTVDAMMLPRPIPVDATWTVSDPSVAKIEKQTIYCIQAPCPAQVRLTGLKDGVTVVTAEYIEQMPYPIEPLPMPMPYPTTTSRPDIGIKRHVAQVKVVVGNVNPNPVGTLQISPVQSTVRVNQGLTLKAYYYPAMPPCYYSTPACLLSEMPIRNESAASEWSSNNPSVLQIGLYCTRNFTGGGCESEEVVATAIAPGTATVTAKHRSGATSSATVTVIQ